MASSQNESITALSEMEKVSLRPKYLARAKLVLICEILKSLSVLD